MSGHYTLEEVGREIGVGYATVSGAIKQYKETCKLKGLTLPYLFRDSLEHLNSQETSMNLTNIKVRTLSFDQIVYLGDGIDTSPSIR